jgi:hypothetical protein
VREAVLRAYHEIGGQEALTAWARKHPGQFYKLMMKLVAREREPNPSPRSVEVFIQTASGAVPVERRRSMFDEGEVIDVEAPERSDDELG